MPNLVSLAKWKNPPHFGDQLAMNLPELWSGVTVKAGSLIDRTVGQHMQALEQKLNVLNAGIMDENDRAKRNQLASELRAVESALTHYRSALEVEERILKA